MAMERTLARVCLVLGMLAVLVGTPAATRAQWPISIAPMIFAPAPSMTPRRIFGWRSPWSLPVPPSVTP